MTRNGTQRRGLMRGVALALWLGLALAAPANTVVFDASGVDRMAAISSVAPLQSWAGYEGWTAVFVSAPIDILPGRSFLIRFPFESIPKGQRITHAELLVPVNTYSGTDPRFYVWRILADWGAGVSHRNRFAIPSKQAWAVPGARGSSSDRATRPSAIVRLTAVGEQVINITEDVELWYTGAAPNYGWLFTIEDPEVLVRLPSPAWDAVAAWKIRITYEPE